MFSSNSYTLQAPRIYKQSPQPPDQHNKEVLPLEPMPAKQVAASGGNFFFCDDTDGGSSSSSIDNLIGGRNPPGQDQRDVDEFPNRKSKRDSQAAEANKKSKTSNFFQNDQPNIPSPSVESSTSSGAASRQPNEGNTHKISKGLQYAMDL